MNFTLQCASNHCLLAEKGWFLSDKIQSYLLKSVTYKFYCIAATGTGKLRVLFQTSRSNKAGKNPLFGLRPLV
jgi:hypothetical protein